MGSKPIRSNVIISTTSFSRFFAQMTSCAMRWHHLPSLPYQFLIFEDVGGLTALPLVKAEVPFNKLEAFISDRLYQRWYFPAGGLPVRGFSLTVPGRRSNVKHLCLDNGQKPSKAFLTSEITIKQANKMKSRKLHAFESIMMPFSCSFRTINLRS